MTHEEWRIAAEYPDYEVSNIGRVRRCTPARSTWVGRVLKPSVSVSGYHRVRLATNGGSKMVHVHRLVLEAFGPPQPTPEHECNHLDGVKTNNHIDNLEWVTRSENMLHALTTGLWEPRNVCGEEQGHSVLTEDDVVHIRELVAAGQPHSAVAERFGVDRRTVSHVVQGDTWSHVEENAALPGLLEPSYAKGSRSPKAKLTEDDVREIRARCDRGELQTPIAKEYGVGLNCINKIALRRTWKHVE